MFMKNLQNGVVDFPIIIISYTQIISRKNMNINVNIADKSQASNFDIHEFNSLSMQESDYNPLNSCEYKNKISKKKKISKKIIKGPLFNKSFWTLEQNILYRQFLLEMGHLFEMGKEQRKEIKINVLMSKLIVTRNPDQCRSHHQKMMKYHNSIPEIISHITTLQKAKLNNQSQDELFSGKKMEEDDEIMKATPFIVEKLLSWQELQQPSKEIHIHLFDEFLFEGTCLQLKISQLCYE